MIELSGYIDVPVRFLVREAFKTREHFDTHQARVQTSDWGRLAAGLTRDYAITQLPD